MSHISLLSSFKFFGFFDYLKASNKLTTLTSLNPIFCLVSTWEHLSVLYCLGYRPEVETSYLWFIHLFLLILLSFISTSKSITVIKRWNQCQRRRLFFGVFSIFDWTFPKLWQSFGIQTSLTICSGLMLLLGRRTFLSIALDKIVNRAHHASFQRFSFVILADT